MTVAEKQTREYLLSQGHTESEIVRRYGASPSLYLLEKGAISRAFEPKLIFGANEIFLTPNELSELRSCQVPTEIIIFRKNSPPKPQLSIPINALAELGVGKSNMKYGDMEIILLPEQMLVRDKKTIKALSVVPKYVLDNLRFIYELGNDGQRNALFAFLKGALEEIRDEALTPESYTEEISKIIESNERKISERQTKEKGDTE